MGKRFIFTFFLVSLTAACETKTEKPVHGLMNSGHLRIGQKAQCIQHMSGKMPKTMLFNHINSKNICLIIEKELEDLAAAGKDKSKQTLMRSLESARALFSDSESDRWILEGKALSFLFIVAIKSTDSSEIDNRMSLLEDFFNEANKLMQTSATPVKFEPKIKTLSLNNEERVTEGSDSLDEEDEENERYKYFERLQGLRDHDLRLSAINTLIADIVLSIEEETTLSYSEVAEQLISNEESGKGLVGNDLFANILVQSTDKLTSLAERIELGEATSMMVFDLTEQRSEVVLTTAILRNYLSVKALIRPYLNESAPLAYYKNRGGYKFITFEDSSFGKIHSLRTRGDIPDDIAIVLSRNISRLMISETKDGAHWFVSLEEITDILYERKEAINNYELSQSQFDLEKMFVNIGACLSVLRNE